MKLAQYSFGTADRFGLWGSAQLEAIAKAKAAGVEIAIVWNNSQREHGIVSTVPADVRRKADEAVRAAGGNIEYHVDADHINLTNVDVLFVAVAMKNFDETRERLDWVKRSLVDKRY